MPGCTRNEPVVFRIGATSAVCGANATPDLDLRAGGQENDGKRACSGGMYRGRSP